MNVNKKTLVVSAIAALALVLPTGWAVFGADVWPPAPYQTYSGAGAWTSIDGSGDISIVTLSPPDPRTGTGSGFETPINHDPTVGGLWPEATSISPGFFTYVMTAPDTGRLRGVYYYTRDDKPKPTIVGIAVLELTTKFTAPDAMEYKGTFSPYSAAADADGDGLPDPDKQPLNDWPITGHMKRI